MGHRDFVMYILDIIILFFRKHEMGQYKQLYIYLPHLILYYLQF